LEVELEDWSLDRMPRYSEHWLLQAVIFNIGAALTEYNPSRVVLRDPNHVPHAARGSIWLALAGT